MRRAHGSSLVKRLCVLLPAYNEAERIAPVIEEVRALRLPDTELSVLVVNDGSRDGTAKVAAHAGATVVSHAVNRGVGAGFRTGRDWAMTHGADFFLHMDADGQVQPREIPLLYEAVATRQADMALGSRFQIGAPANMATWKAVALKGAARAVGLLTGHPHLTDLSCGFRCMNRRVLSAVRPTFDHDYIQETLIQALATGARVVEVPVTILYGGAHEGRGLSAAAMRYSRRFVGLTAFSLAQFYWTRIL